jgi:hypothetical protein
MQTRFKFTNTNLKAIAANDINSRSTELEPLQASRQLVDYR